MTVSAPSGVFNSEWNLSRSATPTGSGAASFCSALFGCTLRRHRFDDDLRVVGCRRLDFGLAFDLPTVVANP